MIACIIGKVISIENKVITVEDRLTKQQYICETEGDDFLNINKDDQGVFVGQYYNNVFRVKRVEIRKFLDPLYEADLYDASGKFNLIPVLNDPFTETYLKYMEQQKEIDKLEAEVHGREFIEETA
jgi:hypothetical protein